MKKTIGQKRVKYDPKPKSQPATSAGTAKKQAEKIAEPFVEIINRLHVAKADARFVVIVGHSFVELVINELIKRRCVNAAAILKDTRSFTHSTKVTILRELGVISDHHFRLLTWFRKLRNDCAHEPFFKVTAKDLSIFSEERMRDLSEFHHAVTRIIADLITTFSSDIGPELVPSNYTRVDGVTLVAEVPAPKYHIPLVGDPKKIRIPAERADEYMASQQAEGGKEVWVSAAE